MAGRQTREHFEVPKEFDLEEFMRPSFGVFQGEPVNIKVWFAADISGYISAICNPSQMFRYDFYIFTSIGRWQRILGLLFLNNQDEEFKMHSCLWKKAKLV